MAGAQELLVTLGLNTGTFTQKLKGVNSEIERTESAFIKASSYSKNFENSTINMTQTLQKLNTQYTNQSAKLELYKSEIEKTKKSIEEKKNSQENLRTAMEKANKTYQDAAKNENMAKEELTQLKKEADNATKAFNSNENQLKSSSQRLIQLEKDANNTQVEINKLSTQINNLNRNLNPSTLENFGKKLQNISPDFKTIGDGLQAVSSKMSLFTVPIAATGVAFTKVSMDFEKSMSKVEAISGATGDDLKALEEKAKQMGESTSKSASEAADALGYMALAGWDNKQMLEGLEPILRLSEAASMDLGRTSDLVTDSMGGLGIKTDELTMYLDQVAKTSRVANTDIGPLLEAFINCGASTKRLNIPLEEANALLGVLANNGTKGAEAGTKLNSILTRMTAQSGPAAEAWKQLGVEVFDSNGKFRGMTTILSETKESLSKMNEEQQSMVLKMAIGTDNTVDFMNMINASDGELQKITGTIKDSNGALSDMATIMQDNAQGKITMFKSKIEGLAIKLGETLLPMFEKAIESLSGLVDWFSNLSPDMQEAIVKFGLFAVAGNAVIGTTGKLFSSLSSISSGLGGLLTKTLPAAEAISGVGSAAAAASGVAGSGGLVALLGSMGKVIALASPWVAGAAAVGAAGYGLYKVFTKELVPSVDVFADTVMKSGTMMTEYGEVVTYETVKISESTKQMVGSYLEMDEGIKNTLMDLYINSTTITEENCETLKTKFSEMGSTITSKLEEDKNENIRILSQFFSDSEALHQQEETTILEITDTFYEDKKTIIDNKQKEIYDILNKAKEENRALTEEEKNDISKIQDEMREQAIKVLSQNELEAKAILEKMKANDARITAEQCSEHIKKLNESRDIAVRTANEEYDKRIATIIKMRDEAGVISADQADRLIEEATRQKDETIKRVEDTRIEALDKMRDMNKDLDKEVDTGSGKILSTWDKMKRWWSGWKPETKKFNATVNQKTITGSAAGSQTYGLSPIAPMAANNTENAELFSNVRKSGSYYTPFSTQSQNVLNSRSSNNNNSTSVKTDKILNDILNKLSEKNNSSGFNLIIEKFVNNTEKDVEVLANELAFLIRKKSLI